MTMLNFIRGVQRPLVVFILAAGFTVSAMSPVVFGASIEAATFAASTLGVPFGIVIQRWFDSRERKDKE